MSKNDMFGIIYASENNPLLRDLVLMRSVGALPIAGRYRAIDFALSNMVNSGIRNISIITQQNYHSLMDHLGSGKEWDLSRRNDGLFLFPPYDTYQNKGHDLGMVDSLKNIMDFIRRVNQKYCLLTGSYTVFNTTYDEMLDYHIQTRADMTMLYNNTPPHGYGEDVFKDVRLTTDESGRVVDLEIQSPFSASHKTGMDIYLMSKDFLIYLVEDAVSHGRHSFLKDMILPMVNSFVIQSFEHTGYVGRLVSVDAFYKVNMDMLRHDIQRALFFSGNPIYTKIKDEVPAQYGPNASAKNCLVANGCIIEGTVENSVLFRGVRIGEGTVIKNSIIMQNSEINEGCHLENVILDKRVHVSRGKQLISSPGYPVIIRKGAVL